ncbi:hypothetical protein STENM223S_02449 [Streptomyces tendae]
MQHLGELPARGLDVPAREVGRQVEELTAALVDEGYRAAAGVERAQLVDHAHPLQHGQVGLAAEVDRLAAAAQGGGQLDNGGLEAAPPSQ